MATLLDADLTEEDKQILSDRIHDARTFLKSTNSVAGFQSVFATIDEKDRIFLIDMAKKAGVTWLAQALTKRSKSTTAKT